MKTAVIYARYSSDLQKDRSIDDQITLCKQIAERNNFKVIEVFTDRAKSAASMFERDGLLALMNAAKRREFDVVIAESLSRVSRDMEDTAAICKRLKFNDIMLIDSNGEVTDVHAGVGGIVNSMFLKNLAVSVKRGRDGRVLEGLIPGKCAYGYSKVPGQPGVRAIDADKAKIVLRIFNEYAEGNSTRDICDRLMTEGVQSPTGGLWNHQKLISGGAFGGMLGNQLYIGKLIWNAFKQIKNPENGKRNNRRSTEKPLEVDVPHLRIVPQELWDRVQAMRVTRRRGQLEGGSRVYKARDDKGRLLLGLLKCSVCGGPMMIGANNMDGSPRVACSYGKRRMHCTHQRSYCLKTLTQMTLDDIKEKLSDPKRLIELTRAYHERWAERQKGYRGERDAVQKELNRVTVSIDRTVTAISMTDDEPVEALVGKLKALRLEQASLKQKLSLVEAQTNVVSLHPAAIDRFADTVREMHAALTGDLDIEQLAPFRHAFHSMVHSIVVHPTAKRTEYIAEPILRIAAITGFDINPKAPSIEEMLAEQGVEANRIAAPTGSCRWQDCNSEGLISLGKWRLAA